MPPSRPNPRRTRGRHCTALLSCGSLLLALVCFPGCNATTGADAEVKPATSQFPVAAKQARGQDYPARPWSGRPATPKKTPPLLGATVKNPYAVPAAAGGTGASAGAGASASAGAGGAP